MNSTPRYLAYTQPASGTQKDKASRKRPSAEPSTKKAPAASTVMKPPSAKRAKAIEVATVPESSPEVIPSVAPSHSAEVIEVAPSSTPAYAAVETSPRPESSVKGKQVSDPEPDAALRASTSVSRPRHFERSEAWDGNIPEEIGMAFFPPRRFLSSHPLLDDDVRLVQDVSGHLAKAFGLSQAYLLLHKSYVRAFRSNRIQKQKLESAEQEAKKLAEDKKAVEAERDGLKEELSTSRLTAEKAGEDLMLTHRALTQANADLVLTQEALSEANRNLADANSRVTELQSLQSKSMDAVKQLTHQRGELWAQLERVQGDLAEGRAAYEQAVDAIRETASECFEMALAQLEFLNPGVKLVTAGYGCRSFFQDGVLIHPPPSPEDGSASGAGASGGGQAGDDAGTGADPDGDGATAGEEAP